MARLTNHSRSPLPSPDATDANPDDLAIQLFASMLTAMRRADYPAATKAKKELSRLGLVILPRPSWGREGGR